jgi:S1-C subfamily serine protease
MRTYTLRLLFALAIQHLIFNHNSVGAAVESPNEKGPSGTIAYYIEVDSSEPGVRIEVDRESVGVTPTTIKVFGDKDGTFHRFKKEIFEIRAIPSRPGQYPQSKVYRTGGFFVSDDQIPSRIYFDMSERSGSGLAESSSVEAKPIRRKFGTGFFISDDGYLITAFHVVSGGTNIQVKSQGISLPATLVRKDQAVDLAILKIGTNSGPHVPLPIAPSRSAKLGERVYTIGFPATEILGEEPKFTDGTISSLAGFQDDWSAFQISVPVYSGNSGGALVNSQGSVIGIVVAKIQGTELLNYAVKSSRALIVLEDLPSVRIKTQSNEHNLAPEELAERLRQASVMITSE